MAKIITGIRIRKDRAEKLLNKSIDLILESKEKVTETDLVNFLIDEFVDRIKIDKDGFFIEEDKE